MLLLLLLLLCILALQIADTLVVKPGGAAPENLCGVATKLWDKVSYILNDDQEVRGGCFTVCVPCWWAR